MTTFELVDHEYIELNKLMKILKWVGSGSEAHQWIDNGEVKVNHATETQRRKKLRVGDVIEFNGKIAKIK